jgi:hypothetical protein
MAMWKTITGVAVLSLVFGGGPTRAQTHVPAAGQGDRGDPLTAGENPSKSADKTNKQKPATSPTGTQTHEPAAGQGDRGDSLQNPAATPDHKDQKIKTEKKQGKTN